MTKRSLLTQHTGEVSQVDDVVRLDDDPLYGNREVFKGITEQDTTLPMLVTCSNCKQRIHVMFSDISALEGGEVNKGIGCCPCASPEWLNYFLTWRVQEYWTKRRWEGLAEALAARELALVGIPPNYRIDPNPVTP